MSDEQTTDDQTQDQEEKKEHILYDAEGNEVKIPVKPDEIQTYINKAEELENKITEREEELKKYQDKEFNFENLRKKSEDEKKEAMKKWSEKEKAMANEIMDMRNEQEQNYKNQMDLARTRALQRLAGEDEDLQKQIIERSKVFGGEAKTEQELVRRYEDAYTLIKESRPKANPLNRFAPMRDFSEPNLEDKRYTETTEGKSNYARWFPNSPSQKKDEKK